MGGGAATRPGCQFHLAMLAAVLLLVVSLVVLVVAVLLCCGRWCCHPAGLSISRGDTGCGAAGCAGAGVVKVVGCCSAGLVCSVVSRGVNSRLPTPALLLSVRGLDGWSEGGCAPSGPIHYLVGKERNKK